MSKRVDLTGRRFGRLTVESFAYIQRTPSNQTVPYWNCVCDCGTKKVIRGTSLKSGYVTSCGCFRKESLHDRKSVDLTGKRFGKLVALEYQHTNSQRHNVWLCVCDCGNVKLVASDLLVTGHTRSCGCIGSSMGEDMIEKAVKALGLSYRREVEFDDLVTDLGAKMRFDFGIYSGDALLALIEFQGEQHFMPKKGHFGELQRTVTDPAKRKYCQERNIPLFEIKYTDNVDYEIYDMLFKLYDSHVNSVPSAENSAKV